MSYISFAIVTLSIIVAGSVEVVDAISYDKDGMPVELTGDDFIILRDVALSDYRVKTLIDGKNYSITDYSFSKPNLELGWYPVLHLRVGDELQIAVAVDLELKRAVDVATAPVMQFQPAIESRVDEYANLFLMIGIGAAIAAGTLSALWLRTRTKAKSLP